MKLRNRLIRLLFSCVLLGCLWAFSLLPAHVVNMVTICALGGVVVLLGVLLWLTVKRKANLSVVILLLCAKLCMAQEMDVCAQSFATSIEEGRWCTYSLMVSQYEQDVWSYIQTFNPGGAQNEASLILLQERVNQADRIVQAFNDLDSARQDSVSHNCHFLDADERDSKLQDRLKKLRANHDAICCAWTVQTLNQIYYARHEETQSQTIPRMLADDKTQCWPCDIVYLLIVLENTMAFRAAPAMASAGIFFLKWFFIFWIAVKAIQLFLNRNSEGKEYGGGQFVHDLFKRLISVMIIALILGDTASKYNSANSVGSVQTNTNNSTMLNSFYKGVVNPVFEFVAGVGIQMTHTLLDGKGSFYGGVSSAVQANSGGQLDGSNFYDLVADAVQAHPNARVRAYGNALTKVDYCAAGASPTQGTVYSYLMNPQNHSGLNTNEKEVVIERTLSTSILCLTQLAYRGSSPIAAIGSVLVTDAIVNSDLLPSFLPFRMPKLPQLFYGLILNIICWLIGILVAFKLIDIMLRLAIVIILMPVFIAFLAFPLTMPYGMRGIKFFFSALMGFIQLALAVGIVVPFFYRVLAGANPEQLVAAIVAPPSSHYASDLYAVISAGSGMLFIYILGVGWLAAKLLTGVQKFFKEVFEVTAVDGIAGKGSLSAVQKSIRTNVGRLYDSRQRVKDNAAEYKQGFKNRMAGGRAERFGSAVGKPAGNVSGHVSVAKKRFYEAVKRSRPGQAAIAMKNKAKAFSEKAKNFMHDNRVARTWRKVKSSRIVNNRLTRGVWATATFFPRLAGKAVVMLAKKLPSYTKRQFNRAVYQFFHPDQK